MEICSGFAALLRGRTEGGPFTEPVLQRHKIRAVLYSGPVKIAKSDHQYSLVIDRIILGGKTGK